MNLKKIRRILWCSRAALDPLGGHVFETAGLGGLVFGSSQLLVINKPHPSWSCSSFTACFVTILYIFLLGYYITYRAISFFFLNFLNIILLLNV